MSFRLSIKKLLGESHYRLSPDDRARELFPLFRACILDAAERHMGYGRYVSNWPVPVEQASQIYELPYLPVSVFKSRELLSLLPLISRYRVVASSGTSSQAASRIVVDSATAKSMSLGAISIFRDFVGSQRRPLITLTSPRSNPANPQLSAADAAVRGLIPLATEYYSCMHDQTQLDVDKIQKLADKYRNQPVLIYGFTYVLWFHFAVELKSRGLSLELPHATVMHSGGWKKMVEESVDKTLFNQSIAEVVGCPVDRVIDFYGMAENIGVVYPDCACGNKHVPNFADVTIRSPLTLQPVNEGERGIIQVGSLLPESFPGHLLLTEDMGTVVVNDGCACGRRGLAFRLDGRIPRAEVRGCGDVLAQKLAA